MGNYLLLALHLLLYTASFLLFSCLRLALSLWISCFLFISSILLSSPTPFSHPFPYFCYLFLLSLFVTPIPFLSAHHRWRRWSPSLLLNARPWSGIRNPSSLLDWELRHWGFGTSVLLTAGTKNRCHFRCQLQADEQQLKTVKHKAFSISWPWIIKDNTPCTSSCTMNILGGFVQLVK